MLGMSKPKPRGPKPDPKSKRSQGGDRHSLPRKAFHAPPEVFAALNRYVSDQKLETSESAVLRLALTQFLEREGYLNPKEGK